MARTVRHSSLSLIHTKSDCTSHEVTQRVVRAVGLLDHAAATHIQMASLQAMELLK